LDVIVFLNFFSFFHTLCSIEYKLLRLLQIIKTLFLKLWKRDVWCIIAVFMFWAIFNYAVKAKKHFFFQWKPCTNETDKGESFSISGTNETGALVGNFCTSDYVLIDDTKYCGGALQNAPIETGKQINKVL